MPCSLDRFWRRYLQQATGRLPLSSNGRRILADFGELALELHQHCAPDILGDTRIAIAELRGSHATTLDEALLDGSGQAEEDLGEGTAGGQLPG